MTKAKLIFTGAACFIAGGASVWFAVSKYYRKKSEDEIKSIREFYFEKEKALKELRDNLCGALNEEQEKRLESTTEEHKNKVFDYENVYVPKTGDVSHSDISAEVANNGRSPIYPVDIYEFGTEEGYDTETVVYYSLNGVLAEPVNKIVIDPVERFGNTVEGLKAEAVKQGKAKTTDDTIYYRDETIQLDTEIEIIDDEFTDPLLS